MASGPVFPPSSTNGRIVNAVALHDLQPCVDDGNGSPRAAARQAARAPPPQSVNAPESSRRLDDTYPVDAPTGTAACRMDGGVALINVSVVIVKWRGHDVSAVFAALLAILFRC